MFILEQKGKYQVIIFGEQDAGRFVKVLMAANVPVAFIDHDKSTGSVLRMLAPEKTDILRRQVLAGYLKQFISTHGQAFNWTEKSTTDIEASIDKIQSYLTWDLVLNQALAEATTAAQRRIEDMNYHYRNS